MKKLFIMALYLFHAGFAMPGVIITGLLDGTLSGGMPKVMELYVFGSEDLGRYQVWNSVNGAPFGSGSGSVASLSGTYTDTFVFLVKSDHVEAFHNVFGNSGIFDNVIPMSIINGNGNDGFQIVDTTGNQVVDQVWMEDATDIYRDSYLYRVHGTGPDSTWTPSCWVVAGNDVLDGLDESGLRASVPFGTYAVKWLGENNDWNDTINWTNGCIPSSTTNVLLPGSAVCFPVIDNDTLSPAVCRHLVLESSAMITILTGRQLIVNTE